MEDDFPVQFPVIFCLSFHVNFQGCKAYTFPEKNIKSIWKHGIPKGKDRLSTINFQV